MLKIGFEIWGEQLKTLKTYPPKPALVRSTIFKDNNGALGLATAPKL
jgi:hypothetical protein